MLPVKLYRPPKLPPPATEMGMLPLSREGPPRDQALSEVYNISVEELRPFEEVFKGFCYNSFYTSAEVIKVINKIKEILNGVNKMELFLIDSIRDAKDMPEPFRFDHFQTEQSKYISKIVSNIRNACTF